MRIIAGSAGGIPLKLPPHDLRPTMDKVKAAIFSSLGERVIGARVLDLFAGSGALGIEALSRGAASATFVESHAQAASCIAANLASARIAPAAGPILRQDVFRWLAVSNGSFDLIFADPPYAKKVTDENFASRLLDSADLARALATDGLFILEMAPQPAESASQYFQILRSKTYGSTQVLSLARKEDL